MTAPTSFAPSRLRDAHDRAFASTLPRGACDKLLTAEDVAEMLGMSKDWIYAEARAGRIPHVKLGRYTRFRAEAIHNWIKENERGT